MIWAPRLHVREPQFHREAFQSSLVVLIALNPQQADSREASRHLGRLLKFFDKLKSADPGLTGRPRSETCFLARYGKHAGLMPDVGK